MSRIDFKLSSVYSGGKWYTGEEWEELKRQEKIKQNAHTPKPSKFPNFKAIRTNRGHGFEEYQISGADGMTDSEIINACDPNNFGGHVSGSYVKVYID